jgi:hypothetical protein
MGRIEERLEKLCREQPDRRQRVVVVLTAEAESARPEDLGLEDAEPIPYQPGMYKAHLAGAQLLDLAKRPEVEEVGPDHEVEALDDE